MTEIDGTDRLTVEDLFLISSSDEHQELVRGVLVRMPPAGALHSIVAVRVARVIADHVDARGLGVVCGADAGYILARNPDVVRSPDASFVARDRVPSTGPPAKYWSVAPDLAVEVVSPADRIEDLEERIEDYFAAGTRLVWVFHPRTRTAHVYCSPTDRRVLRENDELTGGEVVPGFRCIVRHFFA